MSSASIASKTSLQPTPTGGDAEVVSDTPIAPRPDASDDPLEWPTSRKWIVTAALSATGFNRIMVSTIMAPALPVISSELDLSNVGATAALSAFVLATAFSPLLFGPLSEVYGRAPIIHLTNLWFLVFNFACGFVNTGPGLIACRLLAGFGAGSIYALASGVLGDLWPPEKRGKTNALYILVPLCGAAVGPIVGGFVEQYTTWRWIFWSTSALQGVLVLLCFMCYKETHLPTLLRRRAEREQRAQTATATATAAATAPATTAVQRRWTRFTSVYLPPIPKSLLWKSVSLPPRQLATHRSVQLQAALSAMGYGILYLVLSTFSSLYTSQYNESIAISGLHYISLCLGEIIGSQIGGRLMDYLARKAKKLRGSDKFEPEFHLPIIVPGALLSGVGFLLYGWAADKRLPWIVVDIGGLVLSVGLQMTGMGLQAYNMDSYPDSRASTSAAVQLFRSLGAFALPLAGSKMYASLGYGWANTLMAGLYVGGNVSAAGYLWEKGAKMRPIELQPMHS